VLILRRHIGDCMIAWALQGKVFANCKHGCSMLGRSMPGACTATVRKGLSCEGRCFRAKWNGPSTCPLDRLRGGGAHESETTWLAMMRKSNDKTNVNSNVVSVSDSLLEKYRPKAQCQCEQGCQCAWQPSA
jgi:hypothetical protein